MKPLTLFSSGSARFALLGCLAMGAVWAGAGCAQPQAPIGLRAVIGQIADLRPAEPGGVSPVVAKQLADMLGRKLLVRDRFGPDTIAHRNVLLTTELLSVTWQPGPPSSPPLGGTTYLPVPAQGYRLQARVRVHLRNAAGGAPLRSYVIKRIRFQSHALNPSDLDVLGDLLADAIHDAINADVLPLLQMIRPAGGMGAPLPSAAAGVWPAPGAAQPPPGRPQPSPGGAEPAPSAPQPSPGGTGPARRGDSL